MNRPAKARIRASFERAAATYDQAADVQRRICEQLAAGLPEGPAPAHILDAGCGTGYAQAMLQERYPASRSIALDFSPAMLDRIDPGSYRLTADLEHLPLAANSVDLYWSSLAVQWCDLAQALGEARRVLRHAGQLAVATLGPQTFQELRTAFADVDPYRHTLSFHDTETISRMAREQGFTAVDLQKGMEITHYPDFRTLLRTVKAIGANQLGDGRRTHLMSRRAFLQAEATYETLRSPAGLPLTYDVLYLYAQP